MSFKESFQSKPFKWLLIGLAEVVLILTAFLLGQTVGFYKARTSYQWGENYQRIFGGPRAGFFGPGPGPLNMGGEMFLNAHGLAGQVIKIDGNTLVIKNDDNIERTALVATGTVITEDHQTLKLVNIKEGDNLMIIGSPDSSGQVNAKFIRIFNQ